MEVRRARERGHVSGAGAARAAPVRVEVERCAFCPFVRTRARGGGQPMVDVCTHPGGRGPDGRARAVSWPAPAPPSWCPLRGADALVRLRDHA